MPFIQHNHLKQLHVFCFVFLCSLWSLTANAELTSRVDRKAISIEETLSLTVRYTGEQSGGQPDFSLLKSQFDILSNNQNSQYQNYNGRITRFIEWSLTIAPKREGTLLIPSFNFDGNVSDAIEINVTKAAALPQGQLKDIFIETIVDKTDSYVQEQVIVRYRLYYSRNVDSLDNQPLALDNVTIEPLEDAHYRRVIGNTTYHIAEFDYALFPQESGEIIIPALRWQIKIATSNRPRSFFDTGRYEIKRLHTEEKRINVKPKPDAFPKDAIWLPASELTIAELWSEEPKNFSIGEPVTRTLKIAADSLMSSQLPEVLSSSQSGKLKVYTEQADLKDEKTNEGVSAIRTESAAYVISQSGDIVIPAIDIPWWDTDENILKYARLPERKIAIAGTVAAPSSPNADEPLKQSVNNEKAGSNSTELNTSAPISKPGIWKPLTFLFGFLWLSTLMYGLFFKKSVTQESNTNEQEAIKNTNLRKAFRQLQKACTTNDTKQIKPCLIAWATLYLNKSNPASHNDIQHFFNNKDLNVLINKIDESLYGQSGTTPFEGLKLLSILKACIKEKQNEKIASENTLSPLYT